MKTRYGSHYLLTNMPVWAIAMALYFVTKGVLYVIRDVSEGIPYDISYASVPGDMGLIGVVLVASAVLQRERDIAPIWTSRLTYHALSIAICIGIGLVLKALALLSYPADVYHNVVIVPLLLYLLMTSLPVIFAIGRRYERVGCVLLLSLWVGCFVFDLETGRLQQRTWLENRIEELFRGAHMTPRDGISRGVTFLSARSVTSGRGLRSRPWRRARPASWGIARAS